MPCTGSRDNYACLDTLTHNPVTYRFVLETKVSTPLREIQSITWTELISHVLLRRAIVERYVLGQQFISLVQLCTITTTTLNSNIVNMVSFWSYVMNMCMCTCVPQALPFLPALFSVTLPCTGVRLLLHRPRRQQHPPPLPLGSQALCSCVVGNFKRTHEVKLHVHVAYGRGSYSRRLLEWRKMEGRMAIPPEVAEAPVPPFKTPR